MNRTGIFLATAGALALAALVIGLPRVRSHTQIPTVDPGPTVSADGSIVMKTRLSHPVVTAGRSELFVTVDLTGVDVPGAERLPINLALVIDRSGSMSGFKLQQAKQAAKQLIAQLRADDQLAIVHYGSDVKSLPTHRATEANKERMLQFVDQIWDDGGTNIGAGLSSGRDLLRSSGTTFKVNRMILISDGQPTEGMTDHQGLTQLARQIRTEGIAISSIGVGSDFNENLMQAIAEIGSGAYAYLQDASQLATIFQKDLKQASRAVARSVQLSFSVPEGTELAEVFGYSVSREGSRVTIALPDFSAGQFERAVAQLVVTAPAAGKTFDVTHVSLDYTDLLANAAVSTKTKLAALSTDDAQEVLTRRDKEASVLAARAQSAWNTHLAAESLRQGDRNKAQELFQANKGILGGAAAVAGPAAVADDFKEQAAFEQQFDTAGDEESVNRAVKAAKRGSRLGTGRIGSTY